MKDASQYPITFGYKAQDGYWYGPNGKVGKYHRGNDRPCPTGTPIIISGVTIGETGATGIVSGPHLHTQACTAGSNYADDFDPSPFEFKNGTVVVAGWHSQFGNRIVIRVGGVDITYAHLSKINVQVGQVIGGSEVIPDQDNWFWRMDRLMWQIRGRGLSREEFRKNFVGVPVFRMVEILSDDAEANRALEAQNIGQLALKDNWQGQIYSLQDQVKALSSRPTKEQIDVLNKQVTDLTASYNTAQNNAEVAQKALEEAKNKQTEDTKLLDEGKGVFSWITKLIERLKK